MANESITFLCPACRTKLTVPANQAGITGPCPSCQTLIQAPFPARPTEPLKGMVTGPPYQPTPEAAPPYYPPLSHPGLAPTSPTVLRREPRQLPARTNSTDPVAKQMPEPISATNTPTGSRPRSNRNRHPLSRSLLLLVFVTASGFLIFGVATFVKRQSKPNPNESSARVSQPLSILTPESLPVPENHQQDSVPSLPVQPPDQPTIQQPVALSAVNESKTASQAAMEVLETFLAAKTLGERMEMLETKTPTAELEKSCLAGPLPRASKLEIYAVETNATEQVNDFYHNIDFDAGDNRVDRHTILIRTRGTGKPKVVVDPFLDSFGGRLAAYAKAPTDQPGVFQVTIYAVAFCYDEKVPNRENKLTLKLLPRDDCKEITQAYFGRKSKIAEMLEDGSFSLSFGKAKACTILLHWNTEDNPEAPYLEALGLKSLDWNS